MVSNSLQVVLLSLDEVTNFFHFVFLITADEEISEKLKCKGTS